MIEADIVATLAADSAIHNAVGDRVYPLFRPQGDPLPAIVYQRISTAPVNSLSGFSGLDQVRIQFGCYANTVADAKSLAADMRSALDAEESLKGTCVSEIDEIDADTRNFRVIVEYSFWQRY